MAGDMHGRGHVWHGGMHGRVCAWQGGGLHGREGHAWGYVWQGACMTGHVCMAGGGMHAGDMATEPDGTYPTGMHSCSKCVFNP